MAITRGEKRRSSSTLRDSKRAKTGEHDEQKLCGDLMVSIRFDFRDLAGGNLKFSHSHSASEYVEKFYDQKHYVPWLLVSDKENLCLFNLEEKKLFDMAVESDFSGVCNYVVGSSHGCLIYLDENLLPAVLNPLTGSRISLPRIIDDGCIVLKESTNGECIHKEYRGPDFSLQDYNVQTQHWVREFIVHKVILSGNPFDGGENCSVALIYGEDSELAYFNRDDQSWTRLDQEKKHYSDIIFHENKLYAAEGAMNNIEVWDFQGDSPKKLMRLNLSIPTKPWDADYFGLIYGWSFYLVESNGKILLVVRETADCVDGFNNVVEDPELVPNKTNHPLVFPHGTISFSVFELDVLKKQWKDVKSLDGRALFLGGNHSISASTSQDLVSCNENSIYFTDDNWSKMDLDREFGGQDIGVFNMKDGKVRRPAGYNCARIQPSPCWIVCKAPA